MFTCLFTGRHGAAGVHTLLQVDHVQLFKDIIHRKEGCRALLNQAVAAGAAGMENAARYGKYVAALARPQIWQ